MAHRAPRPSTVRQRGIAFLVSLSVAVAASIIPAVRVTETRAAAELVFAPVADAYVRTKARTKNYGTATELRVRGGSDATRSLLRFEVTGVNGPVVSARIRMSVADASPDGGQVYRVSDAWAERAVTWDSAPPPGPTPIGSFGAVSTTAPAVATLSGVSGDGTYSFVISSASTNATAYRSRESASQPVLVIELAGTATPTPTATPTGTPVPTPTPTGTATPTPTPTGTAAPTPTPTGTPIPTATPSPTPTTTPTGSPGPSPTPTSSPPSGPVSERFLASGDAYVWSGNATRNYGLNSTLRVRTEGSDVYRVYLRFDVQGVTGTITAARVRLYVTDPSPIGGTISRTSSWSESAVTWASAPPVGTALDSEAAVAAGQWIELDVSAVVTADGVYDFALTSTSTNSAIYSSREGAYPPELIVTRTGGDPVLVPDASFTATPLSGSAPLAVDFTDTSTGAPSAWAWDFDADGVTDSTVERPIHIYRTPGTYSVRLTVSNPAGTDSQTRDALVHVVPGPATSPGDPVMVGAGDIAGCSSPGDEATAALLDGIAGTVFTTGDNVYDDGTAAEFSACYDPTWGRHRARTRPTVGNHEYHTPGAGPYFDYFGAAAGRPGEGWYSYDLGTWHVVVLNSNCTEIGGCGPGSAQDSWLRADLAASTATCTVALWHHPRFSSGHHGNEVAVQHLWSVLETDGTELVLVGHDHDYERFAPQTSTGVASATGIREIVIGTGGKSLTPIMATKPNSEVRDSSTPGVLAVTLHAGGYTWEFIPTSASAFVDAGSDRCH